MLDPEAPIFDIPEQLRESVLRVFQKEANELIGQINEGFANDDFNSIRSAAHKLKGSSSTAGATKLWQLTKKMENPESVDQTTIGAINEALKEVDAYINSIF